jgi:diacylglycerol O-acyltransferase / wax synthase
MSGEEGARSGRLVRQLTSLDAEFLAIEDDRNYAHVSGLAVLDPSGAPGGALHLADLRQLVEERIHLLPPFRWRLEEVPLGLDHPWWVEDEEFDIGYHVRELALPAPGDDRQLGTQVERIFSRPLDRARPLWEIYLIQGVYGDRAALFTKIHHSVVDGVSGAEILGILFDLDPGGREIPDQGPPISTSRHPGSIGLLGKGAVKLPGRIVRGVKSVPSTVLNVTDLPPVRGLPGVRALGVATERARRVINRRGEEGVPARAGLQAPRTLLNERISGHRHFSFGTLSLDEVKAAKNAYGVKVNDVVVALSAGAIRQFLLANDGLPEDPMVAMVPVSVRGEEALGTFGNQVSAMMAALPTDVPDPVERLMRAHAEMDVAKQRHASQSDDFIERATGLVPPVLFSRAARMAAGIGASSHFRPHFNVIVSNVPGPPVPLYIAGARLESHYPASVIMDGVGLNITVLSYLDRLDVGIVGDRELAPNFDLLVEAMRDELAELLARAESPAR